MTLPLADQITAATTHAERALLLLQAPYHLFVIDAASIVQACDRAHFVVGANYAAAVTAMLTATRKPNGETPEAKSRVASDLAMMLLRFTREPDDATIAMMARHDAKRNSPNPDLVGTPAYDAAYAETREAQDG